MSAEIADTDKKMEGADKKIAVATKKIAGADEKMEGARAKMEIGRAKSASSDQKLENTRAKRSFRPAKSDVENAEAFCSATVRYILDKSMYARLCCSVRLKFGMRSVHLLAVCMMLCGCVCLPSCSKRDSNQPVTDPRAAYLGIWIFDWAATNALNPVDKETDGGVSTFVVKDDGTTIWTGSDGFVEPGTWTLSKGLFELTTGRDSGRPKRLWIGSIADGKLKLTEPKTGETTKVLIWKK